MKGKKLDSLPAEPKIKADLHFHQRFEPENGLEWLVRKAFSKGINLLSITDYSQRKDFDRFTSEEQLEKLPEKWGYYQDDLITCVEDHTNRRVYFVKSEEIETRQGHVLFVGLNRNESVEQMNNQDAKDALKETDNRLIKIVPHPWTFLIGTRGYTDEIIEEIDALEYNAHMRLSNLKTFSYARRNNLQVIANSDAHDMPKYLGVSHTIFNYFGLRFENGENFLDSIKDNIRKGNFQIIKNHVNIFAALYVCFKYLKAEIKSKRK